MKKFTLIAAALLVVGAAQAQDYKNSIGIRLSGSPYETVGASFKTFISDKAALEFDLGFDPKASTIIPGFDGGFYDFDYSALALSGAYQHHFPIGSISGFKWFVGGGAIIANTFSKYEPYKGINIGIFPTGGVDYKLRNAPFAFSADVRPTAMIVKTDAYNGINFGGGVTARYTF